MQRPGWGLTLPEELEDGGDQARVHKLLSQKDLVGEDHLATAALTCTALGLQRPDCGLALPEELEDGRGQARVQNLLSQKDLVGADCLATAILEEL